MVHKGHSEQDGCAADEEKDEPCCALVAHLLLSSSHLLLLLCHTAQWLAQVCMGYTRGKKTERKIKTLLKKEE